MIPERLVQLKNSLYRYSQLTSVLFISFWLTRVFEIINFSASHKIAGYFIPYELYGIVFDTLSATVIAGFLLIPFVLLSMWKERAGVFFYLTFLFVFILLNIFLSAYFVFVLEPLDHVIFTYTFDDIFFAGKSSSGSELYKGIAFLSGGIVLFFILLRFSGRIKIGKLPMKIFPPVAIGCAFFFHIAFFQNNRGEPKNYLANNKLSYFLINCYDHFRVQQLLNKESDCSLLFLTKNFQRENISEEYPLLQKEDTPDVLGKKFNLDTTHKPNIVFIIVESLSKAFVGEDSRLGNFTPFLDSLSKYSLYWPNFLSTAERTFNVLPSSLGSLPYGRNGFMNIGNERNFPDHFTSLRLLKQQGYYTRFYVGCWLHFDNMDGFIKAQNIDYIVKNWDKKYSFMNADKTGYTWGYPDKALFQKSFEDIDSLRITQPRFDILLTVTSHSPFIPPNRKYYESLVEKQFSKINLTAEQKEDYRKDMPQYSSVMYTDDAIRHYFKAYRQRADFQNTIFFIFGDHAMPELDHDKSKIEKYHVPFMIYSPMLKSPEKFESVSSHLNISPSLLALLRENYNMKFPEEVHWLAGPIDTCRKYRNKQAIPFSMQNKDLVEFLNGEYFISYDELYKVKPGLEIEKIEDETRKRDLKEQLQSFISISNKVCYQNKLLPHNNYLSYVPEMRNIIQMKKMVINNLDTDQPAEYSNVINHIKITDKSSSLFLNTEFEYYVTDTTSDNYPCLVLTLTTNDGKNKDFYWACKQIKRKDRNGMEADKWNTSICDHYVDLEDIKELPKEYLISCYFWNNKGIKYKIKNLNFALKAKNSH